jgi:hypothetical protein
VPEAALGLKDKLDNTLLALFARCNSSNDTVDDEMKTRSKRRWSGAVTRHSNALDLKANVFKQRSPRRIALLLKRSAEASHRRKATPFQSAMSMLNFYINRAGSSLSAKQKGVLVRAKDE